MLGVVERYGEKERRGARGDDDGLKQRVAEGRLEDVVDYPT